MSLRTVLRRAARADARNALAYYAREAGSEVTAGFIDDLQATYRRIETHPKMGSSIYALSLDLAGLRSRRMSRFPYIIFYMVQGEVIDVFRILHERRDISALLSSNKPS